MNESRGLASQLRTFLIVTLITVMVWLLAESRMVRTRTVDAQVVLMTVDVPGPLGLVVRQGPTQELVRLVKIEITGSTAGLDRFGRSMQNRLELRVGREIPAQPGIHLLDIQAILEDQVSLLSLHGLVVTDVSPATIEVEVDELETRAFPIRVIMPSGVDLDGVPWADPGSVQVVAPASVLSQIQTTTEATVGIEPGVVAQLAQGRLETIPGVLVDIPGVRRDGWKTQISPGQVDVRVTLRTQTQTHTIARLPVQVLIAPGEIGKWIVEVSDADRDLVNVQVVGPADSIELLQSGEANLEAFVVLSFEDLGRGVGAKAAQILGLPAGCRVVSPEVTVNLQILPAQKPSEPEPAGG